MEPKTQFFKVLENEDPIILMKKDFTTYQYNPSMDAWVDAPWLLDYFMGSQPGAVEITEQEAADLESATSLAPLDEDRISRLQELTTHGSADE